MADDCDYGLPAGAERALTAGERALAQEVFGASLALDDIRIRRRKWFPFQPRNTVMAPCGHVHYHPAGPHYSDDFAQESHGAQGLLVHELTHVWQTQRYGRWWLPLRRHPFCRYDYVLKPDWPIERYGIEQQAEIVRHAWFNRIGARIPGDHSPEILARLLQSVQQRT